MNLRASCRVEKNIDIYGVNLKIGDAMKISSKMCIGCGGTGERYIAALYGDGWTGQECGICNGYGDYVMIDGVHYVRHWTTGAAAGPVLRGPDGRFRAVPDRTKNLEIGG